MAVKESAALTKLRYVTALIIIIFITGTFGFHIIEDWSFLDAFFMTLITITTIGYREIRPLSDTGKIFDIFIIILGVGSATYGFASIARFIVEGEVQRILGRRRLDKTITRLQRHYIICGNGRIGSLIWKELHAAGKPFLVIESDQETALEMERESIPHILGDATKEETLMRAGILRAKGLIATASSDVTNVYITLIAKELNPDIFILARAATEESIKNIKRAGADKVISPYLIGGRHMANIILKPSVVDFIELATGEQEDIHIQMEGFKVKPTSSLIGTTLRESPIRKGLGLIVVAIKDLEGRMCFNPPADFLITPGAVLICIGDQEALLALKRLAGGEKA